MTLDKMFPKTIFVEQYREKFGDRKAFTRQLGIVCRELLEAQEANAKGDTIHTIEEILDVMHSATQLFYLIGYDENEIQKQIGLIHEKNAKRGYYAT